MFRLRRAFLSSMLGVSLILSLLVASPAKADTTEPPPPGTSSAVPDPAEAVAPAAPETSSSPTEPSMDTVPSPSPTAIDPDPTVSGGTVGELPEPGASVVPEDTAADTSALRSALRAATTVSAATAGTKEVGAATNIWGTASGAPNRPVVVQVLVNGSWSTSQAGKTNSSGYYALPLTYGRNNVGTYSLRAVVTTSSGGYAVSRAVTLKRTPKAVAVSVSAATAGTKEVGAATNIWGTASGAPNRPVVVQVLVNGSWSTSQAGKTNSSGYYALPLTYGRNNVGTYSLRAVVTTSSGGYAVSRAVTLKRTGLPAFIGPPTGSGGGALPGFHMALPVQWGATVNAGGTHPFAGNVRSSIDLGTSNSVSIPVVAAADGVVSVGGANGFSRCYVTITHSGGWQTKYYHLKNIPSGLRNGGKVAAGQKLGMTGMPGTETCGRGSFRHVHFTLMRNGVEKPLHGLSLGGYTFRDGTRPYCGYATRDRDGVVVADARGACWAVPQVVNNIMNPSTLGG